MERRDLINKVPVGKVFVCGGHAAAQVMCDGKASLCSRDADSDTASFGGRRKFKNIGMYLKFK